MTDNKTNESPTSYYAKTTDRGGLHYYLHDAISDTDILALTIHGDGTMSFQGVLATWVFRGSRDAGVLAEMITEAGAEAEDIANKHAQKVQLGIRIQSRKQELADRISQRREILRAQLDEALEECKLEEAEELLITLAGMGDQSAREMLEHLNDAEA